MTETLDILWWHWPIIGFFGIPLLMLLGGCLVVAVTPFIVGWQIVFEWVYKVTRRLHGGRKDG